MFTFLHAADIHLDSPLTGLSQHDEAPTETIRVATRAALTRLVDLAIAEKFTELSQKEGFFAEYEKNQQTLQDLESEWEKAAEQLEAIK